MNLAIVTDCLSRQAGGLLAAVRGLAEAIERSGESVGVFGVEDAVTARELPKWLPLKPVVKARRGPSFFNYAPGLAEAIFRQSPNLVETHGLWKYTSIAVGRVSRKLNVPYVVHPHGMLACWAVQNSGWKKKLAAVAYERNHLENAACLRALNVSEAEDMRAFGLTNPIAIIPNGIDLPERGEKFSVSRIGSFEGRKKLLYLGRIHPKKGLKNLLKAWAGLWQRTDRGGAAEEWVLQIAGWDEGGHEAELKQLAVGLGIAESVDFIGAKFDQAKDEVLRQAAAFILPSLSEGLPMSILEAWAYELPVLMTPECNLPEGFEADSAFRIEGSAGKGGHTIEGGLWALFTMSIEERIAMGRRGRQLVEERFTWDQAGAKMKSVYGWLLGEGARPECVRLD